MKLPPVRTRVAYMTDLEFSMRLIVCMREITSTGVTAVPPFTYVLPLVPTIAARSETSSTTTRIAPGAPHKIPQTSGRLVARPSRKSSILLHITSLLSYLLSTLLDTVMEAFTPSGDD